MSLATLPFILHILIETPAALTFILRPGSHLHPLTPSAALLLKNLGGLLLASNLVALAFVRRPVDDLSRHVALALAFWHLWPCYRGGVRCRRREPEEVTGTLGGPGVHLVL
ncbi:hypothetical protein G7046_g6675 [Stylonectria norvegica]|nr:hypothetical protein G7046_g6675 [Stylonectria norvegica]